MFRLVPKSVFCSNPIEPSLCKSTFFNVITTCRFQAALSNLSNENKMVGLGNEFVAAYSLKLISGPLRIVDDSLDSNASRISLYGQPLDTNELDTVLEKGIRLRSFSYER